MPKKKVAPNAGVAPLPEEGFLREVTAPLNLEERAALRAFFASDLWKKVWKNALAHQPKPVVASNNPQLTGILANNAFHVMQGWELCRASLAAQVEAQVPRPPRPADNYPSPLEIEPKK